MALAVETVAEQAKGINSSLFLPRKEKGQLIAFKGAFQRADEAAYQVYKAGHWSLPRSYSASSRRGIIVDDKDWEHSVREMPEVLGEHIVNWSYLKSAGLRHFINLEIYLRGFYPELGRIFEGGQTPKETILGRSVIIEYNPKTLEPIMDVKDRLPKKDSYGVGNCDAAGVEQSTPSGIYFARANI